MGESDDVTPQNMDGMVFKVDTMQVAEWHLLPDGQGKPEQVHLILRLIGVKEPIVVRFKSRKPIDSLIVELITHANSVFGKNERAGAG